MQGGTGTGASARIARGPDRAAIRSWRAAADRALAAATARGAKDYDRARTLPRLVGLDVRELKEPGPALDAAIRAKLERALRSERQRGVAGSWTYDLNRHLALRQALEAEDRTAPRPRGRATDMKKAARRGAGRRIA